MTTTVSEILRQIEGSVTSMAEARRVCHFKQIKFNGAVVEMLCDEVDIEDGSTFEVGRKKWTLEFDEWVRSSDGAGSG